MLSEIGGTESRCRAGLDGRRRPLNGDGDAKDQADGLQENPEHDPQQEPQGRENNP